MDCSFIVVWLFDTAEFCLGLITVTKHSNCVQVCLWRCGRIPSIRQLQGFRLPWHSAAPIWKVTKANEPYGREPWEGVDRNSTCLLVNNHDLNEWMYLVSCIISKNSRYMIKWYVLSADIALIFCIDMFAIIVSCYLHTILYLHSNGREYNGWTTPLLSANCRQVCRTFPRIGSWVVWVESPPLRMIRAMVTFLCSEAWKFGKSGDWTTRRLRWWRVTFDFRCVCIR